MQKLIGTGLSLSLLVGCAIAQQTAPPPVDPVPAPAAAPSDKPISADSPVDDVLDALDIRGKSLSDFAADVTLTDADTASGTDSVLSGKIWMQKLAADDARLRVVFDTKESNGKKTANKSEYALDGGWLLDRDYTKRIEVRRQVLKPGQKMNLLKLGEGPFPLPLGQDKADVHRLFEVQKIAPGKDDPAGTVHVQLTPRPGTQFDARFKTIDFWVDPASRMPVKIETIDPNETSTRTTELKDIKINTKLTDADFVLPKVSEKEWQIRDQPFDG